MIVEDERKSRDFLRELLQRYCPDVEVIGEADSVDAAEPLIRDVAPDLVFLDVEMPGNDGFSLLERMDPIDFDVVFVTAFDQYAVKAFEYSAADYVLKPVRVAKLKAAVQKVRNRNGRPAPSMQLEALRANTGPEPRRIVLPTQEGYQFLELADIVRCSADSNYTYFHLKNAQPVLVSKTLKHVEELLGDRDFFRIHQSHLINLQHLHKYLRGKGGGQVEMADGALLDVSVRRKTALLDRIRQMG